MKSMTKLMVVAMVLAAALVVAPAAAAGRTVEANSTVYIGEEELNLSLTLPGSWDTGIKQFVHYTGEVGRSSIDKTLILNKGGNITELLKGIPIGSYYAQGGPSGDNVQYINVQVPEATLGVLLNNTDLKDSVDGKSITREEELAFKLTNNLNGFPITGADAAYMDIEVTLPGGGVVTYFGNQYLNETWVNGTTAVIKPIDLTKAAAGTYSAQAKWPKTADFYDKGFNSNTVTFEVLSKSLAITSDKDNVVRGKSFTVTVTGRSLTNYRLYIKEVGGLDKNEYPEIVPGQNGVDTTSIGVSSPVNATVKTTAGGTRSVQFDTGSSTKDQSFTIRVENTNSTKAKTDYDEVKVKVEKGSVTITASGTGTYYIGEEITLSGTCTDNDTTVHLFMTGPNLVDSNGVNLEFLTAVTNNDTSSFTTTDVKSDDTWSLKWNTGETVKNKALDAGGYTIYAVSKPLNKAKLSDAQYATTSIQLRSGFITATSSGAVIAKGDDLKLTGVAQGDPDTVAVWIFGKNYQKLTDPATVEDDGSFEYELKGSQTKDLAAGQYFVVIQHPMMNKEFDIRSNVAGWINGTADSGFNSVRIAGLQASDAATALINALDSPNIDDTYVKLTFVVEEPQIFIDAIGDKAAGSKFTITGTTNLAVGDTLNIEVTSAAFQPTSKSEASGFGSVAGTTTVKQGDGANTWSFDVDGSSFKPDQYIVKVECIETDTTSTANFNVVEAVPTTQATPTATGTAVTTPTATATTEATPTQSPGFGALLALAGLGAVAFLVLRRD